MIKSLSYGSIAQKFVPVIFHKKLMLNSLFLHRHLATAAPPVNYYKILGLTPKATQTEIKAAYYKLTKIFHPDVNDDQSAEAAEKFRQIASAYEVLGNLKLRKLYDKGLLPRDGVTFRDSDSEMDFTNKEKAQSPYKRTRSQPSTGRTSAYDFDEWSRVHYGYAMDRRAAAKQKHEANQEKAKNSRKDEQSDYLIFGAILSCLLLTGITLGGRSDFDNISLDDNSNKRDDS